MTVASVVLALSTSLIVAAEESAFCSTPISKRNSRSRSSDWNERSENSRLTRPTSSSTKAKRNNFLTYIASFAFILWSPGFTFLSTSHFPQNLVYIIIYLDSFSISRLSLPSSLRFDLSLQIIFSLDTQIHSVYVYCLVYVCMCVCTCIDVYVLISTFLKNQKPTVSIRYTYK